MSHFWFDIQTLGFLQVNLLIAFGATIIDRFIGYPETLYRVIRHPVVWAGGLIHLLDTRLNRPRFSALVLRVTGALATLILCACVLIAVVPLVIGLRQLPIGIFLETLFAASLISQKSLLSHVCAVADGLSKNLLAGRDAIRHIVGRDPERLDESGIARGAIESLAENMSDGVVAPLFWLLIGGVPGIALYKAVNTADSMIGYKSSRYRFFGTAAARLDDVLNFIPARLTGLLIALAQSLRDGAIANQSIRNMFRDAGKHVSPNAGWPEAAMAGALNIRLGGPRQYDGKTVDLPWLGDGRTRLKATDVQRALTLAHTVFSLAAVALAAAIIILFLLN